MILVREVFRLKIGKAKEAKELWKEANEISRKMHIPEFRALTDLTGPYYTFVLESEHPSLSAWEASMANGGTTEAEQQWEKWYKKFMSLLEDGGRREIYTIVDPAESRS